MATGGHLTILNPNDQTNLDFPPISPIDSNTPVIENNDKRLTLVHPTEGCVWHN